MATMLLLTEGTNGDVLPFIRLGRELVARGHRVVLMTHSVYGAATAETGMEFIPLDTEQEYAQLQRDNRKYLLGAAHQLADLRELYQRNNLFGQWRRQVDIIAQRYAPSDTVVVGRHTSGIAALLAAERYGIPTAWVALSPSQPMTLPVTVHMYERVLADAVARLRAELGLPPVRDWSALLGSPRRQLGLWPEWFDAAGDPASGDLRRCGFVLDDQSERGDLPDWLVDWVDGPEPPVLITGGSGTVLSDDFYRVAIEACTKATVPALVVSRHPEQLPSPLPPAIRHLDRAPFGTLIPRLPAVIHHGGMGTLARSLVCGVPQLVLAHGVDRPDNAQRLRQAGVAQWLPATDWQPERIAELLREALADTGYPQRLRAAIPAVDPAASARVAATELEALVGTDGPPPALTGPTPEREVTNPVAQLPASKRRELAARLLASRASAPPEAHENSTG